MIRIGFWGPSYYKEGSTLGHHRLVFRSRALGARGEELSRVLGVLGFTAFSRRVGGREWIGLSGCGFVYVIWEFPKIGDPNIVP